MEYSKTDLDQALETLKKDLKYCRARALTGTSASDRQWDEKKADAIVKRISEIEYEIEKIGFKVTKVNQYDDFRKFTGIDFVVYLNDEPLLSGPFKGQSDKELIDLSKKYDAAYKREVARGLHD